MMHFTVAAVAAAVLLAGSNPAAAQDVNPAFITKCPAGQWALTFDDGPSQFTPKLLQTLAAQQVQATFFVLGVQLEQANLAASTKAAFDANHLIASHSYNHPDLNSLSADAVKEQMTKTEALIKRVIGKTPNYMRPPFGNCSAVCADVMKQLGYTVSTWNVDSNDWRVQGGPPPANFLDVFKQADPATGHNSLQHDTIQFSVDFVPEIIAAIKAKGMTFVTVDKCGTAPAYREGGIAPGAPGVPGAPGAPGTNAAAPVATTGATAAPGSPANRQVSRQASGGATLFSSGYLGVAAMAVTFLFRM